MPRLNSAGSAVMGQASGQVSIDGTIPAALSTYTGGGWGWFDATNIRGQASTGGGAWQIYNYLVGGTVTLIAAQSANFFAAGGSVWAAFSASSGVTTSIGAIASLPDAYLLDVSPDGQVVVMDSYAMGTGLTVYDNAGAVLFALPSILVSGGRARLRDNILAYADPEGWHLVNVTTGQGPVWYPRLDQVANVIPVMVGSTLMVIEQSTTLSARAANQASGFVIETDPVFFNPDGVASSSSVLRMAYSATAGESAANLLETDLNISTGANERGTVVAGAVVFTTGDPISTTAFEVGPAEGSSNTGALQTIPSTTAVVDPSTGMKVTTPWYAYFQSLNRGIATLAGIVAAIPKVSTIFPGFGIVRTSGQPDVAAHAPNDVLTFASADASVAITTNPITNTVNLAAATDALGYWVPVTDGEAVDPQIVYDGLGQVVVVFIPTPV